MAKLSSRGRTQVVTLVKEVEVTDSDLVSWRRFTISLMSDNNVLSKSDVRFKDGSKHCYGWTVKSKLKADKTPEDFRAAYEAIGYKKA